VQTITVITGTVIGLTFLFGFGNVLTLALRLGVPIWVAPLIAPAVDLSILGLLIGTRHLALTGASADVLRPARRLLIFSSAVTLALNVADPIVVGEYGKAAFDAVGPLMLIGWAEVAPGFLHAIGATSARRVNRVPGDVLAEYQGIHVEEPTCEGSEPIGVNEKETRSPECSSTTSRPHQSDVLLARAREEDAAHRAACQKPISAETLRVRLGIGATPARQLVKIVRAEFRTQVTQAPTYRRQ
jgi:hypothetical protein